MTENFKIIGSFIKDMSSETPDAQTFIFVKDKINKYSLNIDITSKAVKKNIVEVDIIINSNDTNQYYKKIVKPSKVELKLHKEYLKNSLKKNFFN